MIERNSSFDLAFSSEVTKSGSIRSSESLASTSRWTLSSVFGAAIRKIICTGCPSKASYSTPSGSTIAASPGFFTASDLQCGMAIPSPIPVVDSSSLANTPFSYASRSWMFPCFTIRATICLMTSDLLAAFPFSSMLSCESRSLTLISVLLYVVVFYFCPVKINIQDVCCVYRISPFPSWSKSPLTSSFVAR